MNFKNFVRGRPRALFIKNGRGYTRSRVGLWAGLFLLTMIYGLAFATYGTFVLDRPMIQTDYTMTSVDGTLVVHLREFQGDPRDELDTCTMVVGFHEEVAYKPVPAECKPPSRGSDNDSWRLWLIGTFMPLFAITFGRWNYHRGREDA